MSFYQPNQKILNGKYQINKLLGTGAFGEVYLAAHLELGVFRVIKDIINQTNHHEEGLH